MQINLVIAVKCYRTKHHQRENEGRKGERREQLDLEQVTARYCSLPSLTVERFRYLLERLLLVALTDPSNGDAIDEAAFSAMSWRCPRTVRPYAVLGGRAHARTIHVRT
jgi:hypothetical protein